MREVNGGYPARHSKHLTMADYSFKGECSFIFKTPLFFLFVFFNISLQGGRILVFCHFLHALKWRVGITT